MALGGQIMRFHFGGILLKVVIIVGVLILAIWGLRQKEKSMLTKSAFVLLAISGLASGILGIYIEYQHIYHGTTLLSKLGHIKTMFGGATVGIAAALLLTGQLTKKKEPPNKAL